MQTEIIKADDDKNIEYAARRAAEVIKGGGIVAIPTETVYGLACSAFDKSAAQQVFEVKGRPSDNPLIVHIADFAQIYDICDDVPQEAQLLAREFLPGPLTMILKKKDIIPDFISAGLPTVAVRLPSHPAACAIIRAAGVPLAAPSANLSGRPSTTSAQHVIADLYGKIPLIIDGGPCNIGLESTILDLTVEPPAVLRPGGVSPERIEAVIKRRVAAANYSHTAEQDAEEPPKAPGMKYRHYAPSCPCTAVCGSPALCADYIAREASKGDGIICFDRYCGMFDRDRKVFAAGGRQKPEEFARNLFEALRRLDTDGARHIYIQCPPIKGIGLAVMNRVNKSSSGDVIRLHHTKIIGVSGRSGSGKSTVCKLLEEKYGAVHIDCDKIYYELLGSSEQMRDAVNREFGQVVDQNGRLDRAKLSQTVFSDRRRLDALNAITHPFVVGRVLDIIDSAERDGCEFAVIDAPALFDCDLPGVCDLTIAVMCDDRTAAGRICGRDNISRERAEFRLKAQHNDDFFKKNADIIIINNDGCLKDVQRQLEQQLCAHGIKL